MAKVVINITGTLWKLLVNVGDKVEEGQEVAIVESMKMEIPITADVDGIVKKVYKNEADFVEEGELLLELD